MVKMGQQRWSVGQNEKKNMDGTADLTEINGVCG
jgi:hypothetical protein